MTQEEFNNINWHRGNVVRLENGKEYLVKGTKGHGRWLLLFSEEYGKCFVADHNIVVCRTSDYEEPEEVYLEMKRQKQAEDQARRDAERLEYLRLKEERRQKNLQEQERIHQEALARKAAKATCALGQKKEVKPEPKPAAEEKIVVREKPVVAEPVAKSEPATEQPKPKRKRIRISRAVKVDFK